MLRLKVRICGRVQGVLFRHSCRLHAEKLGLTGWIRNQADGSVVLVADGAKELLNELLAWCRKGPPLARVDEVEIEWQTATEEFNEFKII